MVAISAAILSKSGKVLLARQFIPVSKSRIEGYLASFPKLLPLDTQQHTVIDTENVRFIYQPIEAIYVLLVTNKASNIMEDIDTLRLLAKLIPEHAFSVSEEAIAQHVFELIFAFDEAIGANGYKESVTPAQIKSYTEMDSHEEKLQKIITESKMNEAKNEMQRKADSIERQKMEARRAGLATGGGDGRSHGRYASMEGGMGSSSYGQQEDDEDRRRQEREREERERSRNKSPTPSAAAPTGPKPKGMQLGKTKQADDFFTQLNKEEKLAPVQRPSAATISAASASQPAADAVPSVGVAVVSRERLLVELERDGGVKKVQISGEMKAGVYDPEAARIVIDTSTSHGANLESQGYKLQLHPKIDKKLWASNKSLTLADTSKGFPVGSESAPVILKWRKVGDETDLPISVNFWPNQEGKQVSVNVEFTVNSDVNVPLSELAIRIPVGGESPEVGQVDGEWRFDHRGKALVWRIPAVGGTGGLESGSLEFTSNQTDIDAFYPLSIEFTGESLLSGLTVDGVRPIDGDRTVSFSAQHKLEVEKFSIE